ncbi:MAG: hypothetical protein ABIH63_04155 [archaeon]
MFFEALGYVESDDFKSHVRSLAGDLVDQEKRAAVYRNFTFLMENLLLMAYREKDITNFLLTFVEKVEELLSSSMRLVDILGEDEEHDLIKYLVRVRQDLTEKLQDS